MATTKKMTTFIFGFTCHQNIFSITNELASPTRTRNAMVALLAVAMALGVYVMLGSSGYATYGSKVEHDILANYPTANWLVAIARLAISFVVTCCYPLQAHPTRACITSMVRTLGGAELPEAKVHLTITTCFLVVTGYIAFTISDLGLVLSVVGATGSTIVSYIPVCGSWLGRARGCLRRARCTVHGGTVGTVQRSSGGREGLCGARGGTIGDGLRGRWRLGRRRLR